MGNGKKEEMRKVKRWRGGVLLPIILVSLLLTACAKEGVGADAVVSEEPKISEANLTESLEEEISEEIAEEPEADKTAEEGKIEEGYTLVEVSEAIKNSSLEDNIYQVGEAVFDLNQGLTLKNVFDTLAGIYGDIEVYVGNEVVRESYMINAENEFDGCFFYCAIRKKFGDTLCNITLLCEEEEINAYDAKVIELEAPNGKECLNFFYSGNLCAAPLLNPTPMIIEGREAYKMRLKDYPKFKKDQWEDFKNRVINQNVTAWEETENSYTLKVSTGLEIDGKNFYHYYTFYVDDNNNISLQRILNF